MTPGPGGVRTSRPGLVRVAVSIGAAVFLGFFGMLAVALGALADSRIDAVLVNEAGRQRLRSEHLAVEFALPRPLGPAERREAADIASSFSRTLELLERGGRLGRHSLPAPSQEVAFRLAEVRKLWEAVEPGLTEPLGPPAAALSSLPAACEQVVEAIQARFLASHRRVKLLAWALTLVSIAGWGLAVVLLRRHFFSPLMSLRDGLEGMVAGRFPRLMVAPGVPRELAAALEAFNVAAARSEIFTSAVEQSAESVLVTDSDGVILYANPAFEVFTGWKKEDVLGKTPRVLKSGFHPPEFYKRLWDELSAGRRFRARFSNRSKDGRTIVEEKVVFPTLGAAGKTLFVSLGRDVTEVERLGRALEILFTETARETGPRFFEVLVEKAARSLAIDCVIVSAAAPSGREAIPQAFWAPGGLVKADRYSLRGTPCERVLGGEEVAVSDDVQVLFPHDEVLKELKLRAYFGVPAVSSGGRVLGHIAVMHSEALGAGKEVMRLLRLFSLRVAAEMERALAEKSLAESREEALLLQKQQALGHMATGIAHDFNNILSMVGGAADLLSLSGQLDPDSRRDLDAIRDGVRRGAALTGQLVAFCRSRPSQLGPVDACAVVAGVGDMLGRLMGSRIRVESELPDSPTFVLADGVLLEQILLNLAVNARDAMPKGGGSSGSP